MRILVVDDQKTLGLALSGTLARLGHEPQLFTSGVTALELIKREDWRLVITDWMMPEMDGTELCRKIRAARRHPYIYIIMLTGRTDRLDRLEGLAAGADDFLTKPVDEEELVIRLAIAGRILGVQAELEEKNARLHDMANLDPLTGLANRRRLSEGIDAAVSGAAVGAPLSVLAIDLDHFKPYNDAFGHLAGDEVLRKVAATLRANTRTSDLVARFGGEEFIVLLPGVDAEMALQIAEALRASIASQDWPHRLVTASFGIATASNSTEIADVSGLFGAADRALYQSKETGRNRVTHACRLITPPSPPIRENSAEPCPDSPAASQSSAHSALPCR
jgi:two-component system, cell cycle response regulator